MNKFKGVFISSWFDNPYQTSLIKHLEAEDVEIKDYFWSIFFIPKVLKQGKPNVLHLQTLHSFLASSNKIFFWIKFLIFIAQLSILKLLGVKIIWTVHEWADKIAGGQHDIPPFHARIIGKYFDAIITHCEHTKKEIATALRIQNKDKIFVIPHGNYINVYENKITQAEARDVLNIPLDNLVFLLFGGIHRSKGVLEAISAFKNLNQEKIYLLIAGKSGDGKLIESIKEEINGYNNIRLTAELIPDEQIQEYMNACDCVLLPYTVFTTSGVAVLAMSYARACIAPNSGFFKDTLDASGAFLYDSSQEYGLLQAMKSAVEAQNHILDMGQYNFKTAQKWSWSYVASKTKAVYQFCLKN